MEEINNFMDSHKWGGSGIERCVFEFILKRFQNKNVVVELGAGLCSTEAFSKFYEVYSVEDNPNFINLFENVNYILSPIKNYWYDREIVLDNLPKKIDLVFVDGPSGSGNRNGLLDNLDLFENCSFIFHDTYREPEKKLAIDVAKKLNREVLFFDTTITSVNGDFWAFIE